MAENQPPLMIRRKTGPPEIFRITKGEREILDKYVELGTLEAVSKALGVHPTTVKEFIERPLITEYMNTMVVQIANGIDLTTHKVLTKINEIIDSDGARKYEPSYLKALEMAARITKLITPSTTNVNVNTGSESPWKNMDDAEFNKAFKERMGYDRPMNGSAETPNTVGDK